MNAIPPLSLFFVIDPTEARVDSSLSLKDVIGTGHRLDVMCRDLVAALWWGKRLQTHVNVFIAFKQQSSLQVVGSQLLEPLVPTTELGFARLLKEIYVNDAKIPGFHLIPKSIGDIVHDLQDKGTHIFWLDEGGEILSNVPSVLGVATAFIIGDHRGMSEEFIGEFRETLPRLSLGPKSYLGSTCIQLILGRQYF